MDLNLNNMGIALSNKKEKNVESQLECYLKSLEITESETYVNPLVAAMSLRNIADLYRDSGQVENALAAYAASLQRYRAAKSVQGEGEARR